jgi:hypothetical protein
MLPNSNQSPNVVKIFQSVFSKFDKIFEEKGNYCDQIFFLKFVFFHFGEIWLPQKKENAAHSSSFC